MPPQILPSSEQYWRERYGMPPRHSLHASRRAGMTFKRPARKTSARFAERARMLLGHAIDICLKASRFRAGFVRGPFLKASAAAFCAIWLAGGGFIFFHAGPDRVSLKDIYASVPEAPAAIADTNARRAAPSAGFDGLLANFTSTNEAGLVGLRGYVLTSGDGFKAEWVKAMGLLDAAQTAIELDSRGWTDGRRLMELRDMRRQVAALRSEETVLADVVGSENRYPGLRLYREDTDATLVAALALIDEALRSVLASNWPGAAARVDTLAHIRGDVRALRVSLAAYLPSGATTPPAELRDQYAVFQNAPAALMALRMQVAPEDRARVEKLVSLLDGADAQLVQILALKQTPRWDYADYAFKQKVLPLAERISSIITLWRAAS